MGNYKSRNCNNCKENIAVNKLVTEAGILHCYCKSKNIIYDSKNCVCDYKNNFNNKVNELKNIYDNKLFPFADTNIYPRLNGLVTVNFYGCKQCSDAYGIEHLFNEHKSAGYYIYLGK